MRHIVLSLILMFTFLGCSKCSFTTDCGSKIKHEVMYTKDIFEAVKFVSDELLIDANVKENNIIVTSFVNLHKLKETSKFGRIFSENLINYITKKGFKVADFRGQNFVSINKNGEFFLTRDATKLNEKVKNKYVLVGTYSPYKDGVLVNARLIDNITGVVLSASTVAILDYYDIDLTTDCGLANCTNAKLKTLRTIKIVEDK